MTITLHPTLAELLSEISSDTGIPLDKMVNDLLHSSLRARVISAGSDTPNENLDFVAGRLNSYLAATADSPDPSN